MGAEAKKFSDVSRGPSGPAHETDCPTNGTRTEPRSAEGRRTAWALNLTGPIDERTA